jgi:Tol biopolymer transport system component
MPACSPDGHTIAFVGVGRGGFDLYRRAAAGGPAERLTTTGGRSPDEGFPAFSPDGSALVYSAVRHGTAAAVYQLDLRTRRETLLAADDVSLVRPRFSPDGRFLLFVRYPAQWAYAPIVPLAGEVVVQELASGRRLRVADGGDADWLAPRR